MGRLRNVAMFDRVEDEIPWDIGANILPKYIGDDMVLLLGLTDSKARRLMDEENEGQDSLFYSLERWNPKLWMGHKLTWVRCWGIPLTAWDTEQIKRIAACIGDLVDVKDDVEELRKLDMAWVLVKTPWSPLIRHTVSVHIQGEVYNVHITEECGICLDTHSYGRRRDWSLSEEIETDCSYSSSPRAATPWSTKQVPKLTDATATTEEKATITLSLSVAPNGGFAPAPANNGECKLLPSGSIDPPYPTDKGIIQWACAPNQDTVSPDHTYESNCANTLRGALHERGGRQTSGRCTPIGSQKCMHEMGKIS